MDFRERIRVRGQWADESRLAERLERIQSLPEGRDRTFFEVCTALAFDDFAARDVEWAVVEVGLGGRLDCTNVIEPEVCAITSIGLDHTEILGDTIEKIAAEKAGIVKPGVPVVLSPGVDDRARSVILGIAAERGAEVVSAAMPEGSQRAALSRGTSAREPRDRTRGDRHAGAPRCRDFARGVEHAGSSARGGLGASRPVPRSRACGGTGRTIWTACVR